MWENRITLDYIRHDAARDKLQYILNKTNLSDQSIQELHIYTDSGYVYYEIVLENMFSFKILDDGTQIPD
jgi:hypothetical protein